MPIEGIDSYYPAPAVQTPPPEETSPEERAPEREVITNETGSTVDTSA